MWNAGYSSNSVLGIYRKKKDIKFVITESKKTGEYLYVGAVSRECPALLLLKIAIKCLSKQWQRGFLLIDWLIGNCFSQLMADHCPSISQTLDTNIIRTKLVQFTPGLPPNTKDLFGFSTCYCKSTIHTWWPKF